MQDYHGRVCIVTGASSGIGAEFVRALDCRGARVVLFARRRKRMEELAAELTHPHLIVAGDVTQRTDRERLLKETITVFGEIDVLVNNAGRTDRAESFTDLRAEDIDAVVGVNLAGALHLTHAVLPYMEAEGIIINVSSPMGGLNIPKYTLYCLTKAGLSSMSQTLYRELKAQGIHVIDFLPGFTRSEIITPGREHSLPSLEPVRDARPVVEDALDAALRRRRQVFTGGVLARLGLFFNRNFPWLVEQVIQHVPY